MATFYKPSTLENQTYNSQLQAKVGALTSNPTKRDIPAGLVAQFYNGQISLEDLTTAIQGSPTFNPNIGPQINFGSGPVAYNGSTNPADYGIKTDSQGIALAPFTQPDINTRVTAAAGTPDVPVNYTDTYNPQGSTISGTSLQGSQPAASFTRNLGPGASGDDVKELQNWLISQGYQIPAGATGYYGTQTQNAVSQWQQSIGMDVPAGQEGYFGPRSMAALNMATVASGTPTSASGSSSNAGGNTNIRTGIPELDAILDQMEGYVGDLIASGKMLNPNIELDPATVQKFLDQATNEIDPYYAGQIKTIKEELQNNLQGLQKQYEIQRQNAQSQFKQSLGAAREGYAGAGTIFSGQRNRGEGEMVSAQNRALELGSARTADAASSAITSAAKTIGDRNLSDLNIPGFNKYTATNAGQGDFATAGIESIFRPSTVTGSLERERLASILTRQNTLSETERRRRALNLYSV